MSPASFDALDWIALGILAIAVLCLIGYGTAAVISELFASPKRAGNARGGVHPHVPAPPRAPVVDIAEWKLPDIADVRLSLVDDRPERPYLHRIGDVRTSVAPPPKDAA